MDSSERPLLLSSAIALSKLGSGLATIAYLGSFIFYQRALLWIEKLTNSQTPEMLDRFYILAMAAISFVSLLGVIKMGKSKKSGFFFYLTAQISLIVVPIIHIGTNAFSTTNLIFTLIFIAIYSSFYRSFNS